MKTTKEIGMLLLSHLQSSFPNAVKMMERKIFYYVILILAIIVSCSACTQKNNSKTENMEQTEESAEKQAEALKQIDEAIEQYIVRDKFAATSDYPGIIDEELRKPLNEILNILAGMFKRIAHDNPSDVKYRFALKQVLNNMDNVYFDSEDQDQFCISIEALMDIVGLESSGGLLNKWRYGFIPDNDK